MVDSQSDNLINEQKAAFRANLDQLAKATSHFSGNILSHVDQANEVFNEGSYGVSDILEYLLEYRSIQDDKLKARVYSPWLGLELLHRLIPKFELPPIPKEASGRLPLVLDIYETWGINNGYLSRKIVHED